MLYLLFFAFSQPVFAPFPDISLPPSLQAAQAQARASNKLILIDWYNDWCPGCKRFDVFMERHPDFTVKMKEDFIFLKLHHEKGEAVELANQLEIRGWPHFTLYTSELELVSRWVGFLHKEGFQQQLDYARQDRQSLAETWPIHQDQPTWQTAARLGEYFASTNQHDWAVKMFRQVTFLKADLKHYAFWEIANNQIAKASQQQGEAAQQTTTARLQELDSYLGNQPNATLALFMLDQTLLYDRDQISNLQVNRYLDQASLFLDKPYQPLDYLAAFFNEALHESSAHSLRSHLAIRENDWDRAYHHRKEALALLHESVEFQRILLLEWASEHNRHLEQALAETDPILKSWEGTQKIHRSLAHTIKDVQLKLNQTQAALKLSELLMEKHPDLPHGYLWATETYSQKGDHQEVSNYAEQALSKASHARTRNKTRYIWAKSAIAQGHLDQAKAIIAAAEPNAAYFEKCQELLVDL
jgi:thioredoxin-related protein